MPHKDLIARLEAEFLAHDDGSDASHDINHARRVMRTALQIAATEGGGDEGVIIAAAYLHDWVNLPKNDPNRSRASQLSADAARPMLASLGFAPDRVEACCHAILTHSFSANIPPLTLEARALQDADRLEALGAIGLARVFSIAGRLGSALFDGEDPFAQRRPLDDRRYAVDHFEVKLLRLPETMQTAAGRGLADERAAVMRSFLSSLASELGREMPW